MNIIAYHICCLIWICIQIFSLYCRLISLNEQSKNMVFSEMLVSEIIQEQ
jgi:hypothetical protein